MGKAQWGANQIVLARLNHFGYQGGESWLEDEFVRHPVTFGFGYSGSALDVGGIHSRRTNYRGTAEDPARNYKTTTEENAYHFEGRRWNMLAISWLFGAAGSVPSLTMLKNGQASDPLYHSTTACNSDPKSLMQLCSPGWSYTAPIRLGAFARIGECHIGTPYSVFDPADSTFGEMFVMQEQFGDIDFMPFWKEGFYYHDPDKLAAYTTPDIDFGAKPGKPVSIRSISWTGRWPEYVRADPVVDDDKYLDPVWGQLEEENQWPEWLTANYPGDDPRKWTPFLVDIKTDDTWHYEDDATKMIDSGGSTPTNADGYKLVTDESIQLKFYFNLAADQIEIRESPYLDDITITYVSGTKFLFYQMH
ncbi:hypothetical protein ACFL54_06820 [Planctomycetota bacterium]